ncbi:secretory phospholipase A2 receptor-like [Seriola aureovittata]|uniref:secretory phospholipase A2 receptor-like n=1 Tax=Seriola aureovittata TaxID=2871759 RepID=UPI0024BD9F6A|nr:secretory phospholipase A2 receptor-like [Seriola aureovittata]
MKTGVGVTGNDVSWNSKWADGQHSGHCAIVGDDQMWYSVQCSSEYNVYCLAEDKIIYHEVTLSWHNASQFCQDMGSSLATITKRSKGLSHSGWIGLYQQDGLNWDWIGDLPSDYRNWAPREPLTADCGSFNSVNEKLYSKKCSEKLRLICYSDNLVVVNKNKTWEEALRHCRNMKACTSSCTHHYDILSLPYLYEYSYVRDRIYRATTDEVGTGAG